jgi:hypothetical protein
LQKLCFSFKKLAILFAMNKTIFLLIFAFFGASNFLFSQEISTKKLKKHVTFLASDKLMGRGTGTPEELVAANYIAAQFKKIGLQPAGQNGSFFHHFSFHKSLDPHGTVDANGPEVNSQNVAGYLDNGATSTIIIGAHYDHLGLGHDHNSLDANPDGKIHNGADDNASGTAGVIELARFFKKNKQKEPHNFLFLCFSGEELGLLGSKKIADSDLFDAKSVDFMINMDMIGRLDPVKKSILVGGVGTSPTFVPLVNSLPHPDFLIKQDSSGIGPSDHTSFYLKKMPVLFVFTGQHSDYHKPSDDVEKINFDGEKSVLNWVISLIQTIEKTTSNRLIFQETKSNEKDTPRWTVSLGIMPDYTFEGPGVRADGVTEGKPGFKAGLKTGDIIRKMGEIDVTDMQAYMKGLSKLKKGDSAVVKVQRGDKFIDLDVNF